MRNASPATPNEVVTIAVAENNRRPPTRLNQGEQALASLKLGLSLFRECGLERSLAATEAEKHLFKQSGCPRSLQCLSIVHHFILCARFRSTWTNPVAQRQRSQPQALARQHCYAQPATLRRPI